MSADKLYTPAVLAAAMRLSGFVLEAGHRLRGEARARSCGSNLTLGMTLDNDGRIDALGLAVHACAIGQASATVFAEAAAGRDQADITASSEALDAWLAGTGPLPDWPGIALIAPAQAFPGRHGAIVLPWRAALRAFAAVPA